MRTLLNAFIVGCGLLAVQAFAQTSTQEFVSKVAVSDMFEIQSSKLAEQRGNPSVKSFAQRMVKDHTKTSTELKGLAGKAKLKLPGSLDADHRAKIAKLEKIKGEEFSAVYAQMQVAAHEEAVKLFEVYSSGGENNELKTWAGKTLPALKEHLEHARKLK